MNATPQNAPPRLSEARPRARWALVLGWLVGFIGLAILFFFNPAQYSIYPRCQFHAITGLDCPACGALRALHQLLHGHLGAAFRLNALLVLSLPVAGWLALRWATRKAEHQAVASTVPAAWLWCALVAAVAFGVLRNLPLARLALLAP